MPFSQYSVRGKSSPKQNKKEWRHGDNNDDYSWFLLLRCPTSTPVAELSGPLSVECSYLARSKT